VAGIYNRFQYIPEMLDALTKWEAHLQALVAEKIEIYTRLVEASQRGTTT
jgi:hypothetical protein